MRGTIHLETPAGETAYENRYVIWGRMSWGILREYEVYEDTQKSTALDEHLAAVGELDSQRRQSQLAVSGMTHH